MKKIALTLACLLVLSFAVGALAETKITVSGNGEVLVAADTAVITLGINFQDADVLKAQGEVNRGIEAIRASLLENGIQAEDINTDRLRIYAVYDYSGVTEKVVGYNASSYLAIRTQDMEKVGEIIDIAFRAGANTLDGINFSASDTEEASKDALTKSVKDARAKAETIAAAAGLTICSIESINESYSYSYDSGMNSFYKAADMVMTEEAAMAGGRTVVQAAKLTVSSSVTVVFIAE